MIEVFKRKTQLKDYLTNRRLPVLDPFIII